MYTKHPRVEFIPSWWDIDIYRSVCVFWLVSHPKGILPLPSDFTQFLSRLPEFESFQWSKLDSLVSLVKFVAEELRSNRWTTKDSMDYLKTTDEDELEVFWLLGQRLLEESDLRLVGAVAKRDWNTAVELIQNRAGVFGIPSNAPCVFSQALMMSAPLRVVEALLEAKAHVDFVPNLRTALTEHPFDVFQAVLAVGRPNGAVYGFTHSELSTFLEAHFHSVPQENHADRFLLLLRGERMNGFKVPDPLLTIPRTPSGQVRRCQYIAELFRNGASWELKTTDVGLKEFVAAVRQRVVFCTTPRLPDDVLKWVFCVLGCTFMNVQENGSVFF
jgi:hypothetical protein